MYIRYWLNVDESSNTAHLVALATPLPRDCATSNAVTGYAFRNVRDTIAFVSHVLDVTHGDADGIIMAQQMQGQFDIWIDLDQSSFDAAVAMGSIVNSVRAPLLGYRNGDGRVYLLTGDPIEPDITRLTQ